MVQIKKDVYFFNDFDHVTCMRAFVEGKEVISHLIFSAILILESSNMSEHNNRYKQLLIFKSYCLQ